MSQIQNGNSLLASDHFIGFAVTGLNSKFISGAPTLSLHINN